MPNRFFVRKAKVAVQLQMSDGVSMKGNVFINIDSRVLNLMNDTPTFVPFEAEDMGRDTIEKVAIMGDHDRATRERSQCLFEHA